MTGIVESGRSYSSYFRSENFPGMWAESVIDAGTYGWLAHIDEQK
jgi:hypothetical protein